MRVYLSKDVLVAARERINWLFDEFKTIVVSHSGGKDSTVIFNLTLEIARERNRLPLPVVFLDQEVEWQSTIDMIESVMTMDEVEPHWLQVPFKLGNSTSPDEDWVHCWNPDQESIWMREKSPLSIKENNYGTDRFVDLIIKYGVKTFGDSTAYIAGVRAEESPTRTLALTRQETYKGVTWGKKIEPARNIFTFYPVYDWSYTDIWKYIYDNHLKYAALYDYQYRFGVTIGKMRLSSLTHSTALEQLHYMQEVEPYTWERLTQRIRGINTERQLSDQDLVPKELPYMFTTWQEYRDYLLDNMIPDPEQHDKIQSFFEHNDLKYYDPYFYIVGVEFLRGLKAYYRNCIRTIIRTDYHLTFMDNFRNSVRMGSHSLDKTDAENRANWLEKWEVHGRKKNTPIPDPESIIIPDEFKYRRQNESDDK